MNEVQFERLLDVLKEIRQELERIADASTDLAEPLESLAACVSTDGDETVFTIWKAGESE